MKKTLIIFSAIIVLLVNPLVGQSYKQVVLQNSSEWYFAHKQLSGQFIDTIFAGDINNDSIDIWYRGIFGNGDLIYAGKIRSSEDNSMLWYTESNSSEEKLIYDITLEKGDTFDFLSSIEEAVVDTTYILDDRKVIEFNYVTNWYEPIRFIEGI